MPSVLHLIAPSSPPKICGVGDHSLLLGRALASRGPLVAHCGQRSPEGGLEGIETLLDFDSRFPWTLGALARSDRFRAGDTILFQYTNFAYGRYGFNPWLAPALRRFRNRGLRVATMFHETYMPAVGIKIRLMGAWQRRFFRQVGLASDLCMFSVEPWTRQYASWFPKSNVRTLPVGSNMPLVATDRAEERRRIGVPPEALSLVVFGGTHPSRLFEWVVRASRRLSEASVPHAVVHVGPDGEEVARRLEGAPLVGLGIRPPEEVSRALSTADIFLSPISDGASSRRGSLLAGLQHGLCCLTTQGPSTDAIFEQAGGKAMVFAKDEESFAAECLRLAADPDRRVACGREASRFYEANYSWSSIAETFERYLSEIGPRSTTGR